VKQYSRKQVNMGFLSNEGKTEHALPEYLANRLPNESQLRLLPKHQASENPMFNNNPWWHGAKCAWFR
jgi:hypothetical protein